MDEPRIGHQQLRIEMEGAGHEGPLLVTARAKTAQASDRFGESVAIRGDTAVLGARLGAADAAYLFQP